MASDSPVLVFIYLAESGLLNKLKDAVHKTFSPKTYPCNLCDITYSPVAMRKQWKRYVANLPIEVEFSYTDLIEKEFPGAKLEYPSACLRHNGMLETVISAGQMNQSNSIDDLIALVNQALAEKGLLPQQANS